MWKILLEAVILAAAVSIDAFAAAFSYGTNRIRIPMRSVLIMDLGSALILGLSLCVGDLVRIWIPPSVTLVICFVLLFGLGIVKLLDGITKSIIRRHQHIRGDFQFSCFNFRFVLTLYADPEAADVDASKTISPLEAVSLTLALSLDGLAVGFGAALGEVHIPMILLAALVITGVAILLGSRLGEVFAKRHDVQLSWLSGALLIVMAFIKLFA